MGQEQKLAQRQQGKKRNELLPCKRPCGPTGAYGFGRVGAAVYYTVDRKTRPVLNLVTLFYKKYFPTVDGDSNISPGVPCEPPPRNSSCRDSGRLRDRRS